MPRTKQNIKLCTNRVRVHPLVQFVTDEGGETKAEEVLEIATDSIRDQIGRSDAQVCKLSCCCRRCCCASCKLMHTQQLVLRWWRVFNMPYSPRIRAGGLSQGCTNSLIVHALGSTGRYYLERSHHAHGDSIRIRNRPYARNNVPINFFRKTNCCNMSTVHDTGTWYTCYLRSTADVYQVVLIVFEVNHCCYVDHLWNVSSEIARGRLTGRNQNTKRPQYPQFEYFTYVPRVEQKTRWGKAGLSISCCNH